MKIKKAKLKQIIQEELQKLSEQSPGRTPGRARGNDPARLQRIKDKAAAAASEPETFVGKPDLAANQAELAAIEDEQRRKRDELYDLTMSDEQDIDYGGDDLAPDSTGGLTAAEIEAQSGASWEGEEEPSGEAPAPAAAPSGRPKARVASDQMRKNINKAWKSGKIDKDTWRKARRALYKSADSAAAILAAAGVDANTGEALAVAAAPSAAPSVTELPDQGRIGTPEQEDASAEIARLTTGFGELSSGAVPSDPKIRKRFTDMASRLVDGGMPRRAAVERARGTISSLLQNKIAKLKLAPDKERMLAKRAERSKKARGRELDAIAGDTGTDLPFGAPGQFEESLNRLTKIVEEEFDKVLAEKEKKTTVSGDVPTHTIDYEEKDGYMHAIATTKDGIVGKGKAKIRNNRKDMARTAASVRARVALVKAAKKKAAVAGTGKTGDN